MERRGELHVLCLPVIIHSRHSMPSRLAPSNLLPALPRKLPVCLPSCLVQCEAAPSVDDIIDRLLEAEPKPVADMSADERQAALLAHLCHMQVLTAMLPQQQLEWGWSAHSLNR